MSRLATNTEILEASDVGCHGCQHRVDVPGVDQVVCLAYLTVFTTTIRDACQEFEAKASPPAAIAGSPAP